LKKIIIQARIFLEKIGPEAKADQNNYIGFLEKLLKLLEETKLIQAAMPYLEDYRKGERDCKVHCLW